jgi:hypothetical protein
MAYSLNGNNAKIDFSIGNLVGVDGGPISVASLVKLGDASNGALAHIVNSSGAAGVLFVETFGTLNYGVNTIARPISSANLSSLGVIGNWAVLGASKVDVSGNPTGHYGVLGSALTHFTATASLTDVGVGSAADSTFKIRIGQFLNSASEFINGEFAVDAIWKRVLSNAEWDSLSTGDYTTWQALNPDWMVEYTGIGSRSDATGGGGNELSRTGTPAISLVADPAGFFGSGGPTSTDSATLSDGIYSLATHEIESITLSDSTFTLSTSNTDSATLVEGTPSVATTSTDLATLTESERISVVSTDGFSLGEGTPAFTVKISEAFSLTEATPSLSTRDGDTFMLSDATSSAAVKEFDSFTFTDTLLKLNVTDSDSALLSEAQRGSVTASDSFMLDDTAPVRVSLGVVDQFTLISELEHMGIISTDAFILSDAVFTGKGAVTGSDLFALIEHEHVDGIPQDSTPSVPITIRLSSPSIVVKFGTPRLVISLTAPGMRIELE